MTKARDLANGGFGLVLIKPSTVVNGTDNGKGTVSFSAASSVSLNGVFNSTYDNYRMLTDIQGSGNMDILLRFRVSGSDASGANYNFVTTTLTSSAAATSLVNQTSNNCGFLRSEGRSSHIFEISRPFLAEKTRITINGTRAFDAVQGFIGNGEHQLTTSYDGFTLIASSGTFAAGTVSVYGYNK
jgi:hypothetical protein